MAILTQAEPPAPFELPAPAKLNLFLHITGRRDDGYHTLQTVFQLIDLQDTLSFGKADDLVVHSTLPGDMQDNLIYRAARLLQQHTDNREGCDVRLTKRIPVGAGLGGGSSNAATTLLGLNALWQTNLGIDELAQLGANLGADVPVFVRGHSAWAEGIGDELTPLVLPSSRYVLVYPGVESHTGTIYANPHLTRDTPTATIARFLDHGSVTGFGKNDCESVACRLNPTIAEALGWLRKWGAARMSGSGSCVFLKIESEQAAAEIKASIPSGWSAYVTRGVNQSPLISAVASLG